MLYEHPFMVKAKKSKVRSKNDSALRNTYCGFHKMSVRFDFYNNF
jgi:hypothetical protein